MHTALEHAAPGHVAISRAAITLLAVALLEAGIVVGAAGAAGVFGAPHAAAQDGATWRATLQEGCDAAKMSGKPVLVVTVWKDGVCNSCDTWRSRVRKDPKFLAAARRFETVEWLYDGLEGKVIPWTLENGGTSRDPSAQAFVVAPGGKLIARCPADKTYVPSQIAEWLDEQASAYERDHPRTAMAFRRADIEVTQEGTAKKASCAVAGAAHEAGRGVVVYVGRDAVPEAKDEKLSKDDKARRAESVAAREFERRVLDAKSAADASSGWTLLRLDLSDEDHALWAASLGIDKAPALVLIAPGDEKPFVIANAAAKTITGADLAFRLKKAAPAKDSDRDAPK